MPAQSRLSSRSPHQLGAITALSAGTGLPPAGDVRRDRDLWSLGWWGPQAPRGVHQNGAGSDAVFGLGTIGSGASTVVSDEGDPSGRQRAAAEQSGSAPCSQPSGRTSRKKVAADIWREEQIVVPAVDPTDVIVRHPDPAAIAVAHSAGSRRRGPCGERLLMSPTRLCRVQRALLGGGNLPVGTRLRR